MSTTDSRPLLHVVAGIILNGQGEYLLSSRPAGKPYAGYWEFAGGKVEAGENETAALQREFEEELGIRIHAAVPWLCRVHSYEHARVRLRFYRVAADQWSGDIQAREGQTWSWQKAGDFTVSPMLPANGPLLKALSVPTELALSANGVLCGENGMGAYRVVPYASALPQEANILLPVGALQTSGRPPQAESVWVEVADANEYRAAAAHPATDVLLWRVADEQGAQAVLEALDEGCPVPLAVAAPAETAAAFRSAWLAAGAQAVVIGG